MNFGSMWVVRILPAIFLTRIYGLMGFWMCMAVELSFRGAIFLIRLYRGRWLPLSSGSSARTSDTSAETSGKQPPDN